MKTEKQFCPFCETGKDDEEDTLSCDGCGEDFEKGDPITCYDGQLHFHEIPLCGEWQTGKVGA